MRALPVTAPCPIGASAGELRGTGDDIGDIGRRYYYCKPGMESPKESKLRFTAKEEPWPT